MQRHTIRRGCQEARSRVVNSRCLIPPSTAISRVRSCFVGESDRDDGAVRDDVCDDGAVGNGERGCCWTGGGRMFGKGMDLSIPGNARCWGPNHLGCGVRSGSMLSSVSEGPSVRRRFGLPAGVEGIPPLRFGRDAE